MPTIRRSYVGCSIFTKRTLMLWAAAVVAAFGGLFWWAGLDFLMNKDPVFGLPRIVMFAGFAAAVAYGMVREWQKINRYPR